MERNYLTSAFLHPFFILILLFCNQGIILSQGKEPNIKKDLQEYMNFIASDATEGRFTGTSGYKKAADYAIDIFRKAGLQPGWTNEKGEKTYLQPVPFIRHTYDTSTFITIKKNNRNKTFTPSASNFVIINPGNQYENMPIASPVFIGYGIHEPENGWDDYAGVDVMKKWVLLLNGIPPVDANPEFPNGLRKQYTDIKIRDSLIYKALIKHQVAGVIVLPNKYVTENWEYEAPRKCHFYYMHYADDINLKATPESVLPNILISPNLAEILLDGQSYNPITNKGNYHSYILSNTEIGISIDCNKDTINCYNVVAVLPGTDSSLRNEYLTVGAHLDHLGKMGNHVYNGANDDASGCATILGAAKAVALSPPKRPVLFILYTSEEQNLIGSKHFLKYPPIPIEQILLNINIEQIGSKNRDYNGIWGIGSPQFNDVFSYVSNSYRGTNFKYDDLNENYRNALKGQVDSWSYIKKGIPSFMLSSGGFPEHHKHEDKIDLIDFDHLLTASNFLYSFIVELGNK